MAAESAKKVIGLITSVWSAQSVATFARLKIPDVLKDNQILTAAEIAEKVGANHDAVFRLLRFVATAGFVNQYPDEKFQLNESGYILRSDVSGSLRASLLAELDEVHWISWGNNIDAVKKGTSNIEKYFPGCDNDVWSWYKNNPDAGELFAKHMSGLSVSSVESVLNAYEFPKDCKKVIDVGGSEGYFLEAVMSKIPNAHGVVYDLPEVAERTAKLFANSKLSSKLEAIGGDFFKSVPSDGDIYLLKMILHDWDDEKCIQILSNIQKVMSPNGRVVIVECEIEEIGKPGLDPFPHGVDVNMLVMTFGKERTVKQYESLLTKSGLKLNNTVKCPPHIAIESVKQ
jgi:hypothetical protein